MEDLASETLTAGNADGERRPRFPSAANLEPVQKLDALPVFRDRIPDGLGLALVIILNFSVTIGPIAR